MDVTKPYKFIGFGAMEVTKPYIFIGFGAMEVTKLYKFIGFGAMEVKYDKLWGCFVFCPMATKSLKSHERSSRVDPEHQYAGYRPKSRPRSASRGKRGVPPNPPSIPPNPINS
jgi:hypothetical protein